MWSHSLWQQSDTSMSVSMDPHWGIFRFWAKITQRYLGKRLDQNRRWVPTPQQATWLHQLYRMERARVFSRFLDVRFLEIQGLYLSFRLSYKGETRVEAQCYLLLLDKAALLEDASARISAFNPKKSSNFVSVFISSYVSISLYFMNVKITLTL